MDDAEVERAVAAGRSAAVALGLRVDDAVVVHRSNRIAVHLTPCDVLVRVALPRTRPHLALEVDVADRLSVLGSPVAEPDARVEPVVHERDGFLLTFWRWYRPVGPPEPAPAEYADVLLGLHAGLRRLDLQAPHFTDRVAEALAVVTDPAASPALADDDRRLLADGLALASGISRPEQLLHGEPHVGNLVRTERGLLVIDFETCCVGPVELDIAHGFLPNSEGGRLTAADEVCARYPAADPAAVERSRTLIWAMITAWRWQRGDRLPNREHWAAEGLRQLRAALGR